MPHDLKKLTPNLVVSDVQRSLAFYRDGLGFEVTATVPEAAPFVFAAVQSGPVEIFLNAPEPATAEYPAFKGRPLGGTLTLFIEVAGIASAHDSLKDRVKIVMPLEHKWYGVTEFAFEGLDAFFAYSPIERQPADPSRIYRSFRWGQDVEVFVLDARSYRDRNDLPDTAENDKDMLGKEQIAWLVEGIRTSTATWKIVSSDVPMSITTGSVRFGRDAWANLGAEPTGFERELLRMLSEFDRINAENVVFVTTDVHFAQTIAYDTDADGDGDRLVLYELVCGPLNAVRGTPRPLDPAANPTSLYAEGGIFNFSYVRIQRQPDGNIHLIADVRGSDGAPRPGSHLDLTPR